ncbi:hypothetical protein [Paeniglutamicibacter sp.]|uniref:hypothetical protein n=1 Tax=Paeniglutamicibacter sp. TaxID=1934391 RepID=UPI0039892F62
MCRSAHETLDSIALRCLGKSTSSAHRRDRGFAISKLGSASPENMDRIAHLITLGSLDPVAANRAAVAASTTDRDAWLIASQDRATSVRLALANNAAAVADPEILAQLKAGVRTRKGEMRPQDEAVLVALGVIDATAKRTRTTTAKRTRKPLAPRVPAAPPVKPTSSANILFEASEAHDKLQQMYGQPEQWGDAAKLAFEAQLQTHPGMVDFFSPAEAEKMWPVLDPEQELKLLETHKNDVDVVRRAVLSNTPGIRFTALKSASSVKQLLFLASDNQSKVAGGALMALFDRGSIKTSPRDNSMKARAEVEYLARQVFGTAA